MANVVNWLGERREEKMFFIQYMSIKCSVPRQGLALAAEKN
jgi:hypothetical protein